ncbi:MAG: 3-phosphoshikimate 1-carboxyvinyltransferase [Armatimonadota bacterium]|nr:3-phosphoshikimate 1-carboxyvinyltransferase [Armatimonadota bacterium]
MRLQVNRSTLTGIVPIPGSKSHTVRAVALASLADGDSRIRQPLVAADTLSAVEAYRLLGAEINRPGDWMVRGVSGQPCVPENVIDVGNSGTSLYIALGSAALVDGVSVFTGDDQIRRRPAGPLIDALNALGAKVESTRGGGLAPIIVRGPMWGGEIELDSSKTSQYLTSLLINCPLAAGDSHIKALILVERPYIDMTLRWARELGVEINEVAPDEFEIKGGQRYRPFDKSVPADFSSATFFLCAAAITGSTLTQTGLDMADTQGDKAVVDMLRAMGAKMDDTPDGLVVSANKLIGCELDLSNTPDALPALAVTACFAEGETRLVNVAQARLKETDRIAVMREELSKMGADIEELPDGLVIRGRPLKPAAVHGHHDHRVIMALAIAGLALDGETTVYSAEALSVTFPTFIELMRSVGADISSLD